MNKTRIYTLVIVGSLVIAAVFTLYAYLSTTNVQATNLKFTNGFGDLRHYEAEQNMAGVRSGATGFGELRRVEAQQNTAPATIRSSGAGFGDLRRFEAEQALQSRCLYLSSDYGENDAGVGVLAMSCKE